MSSALIREDIQRARTSVHSKMWFGFFSKDVASTDDLASIIVPDFDPTLAWHNVSWQANGATSLPQKGDPCLVAFDNRNQPWIVTWTPGGSVASPVTMAAVDAEINALAPGIANARVNALAPGIADAEINSLVPALIAAHGPKVTASVISGGPPASPSDGDIWIALAAGASGENWAFRYNSGSASVYKWEFIGGSKVELFRNVSDLYTSNSTWINDVNLGNLTIPRAGEYIIAASGNAGASASGAQTLTFGLWYNGAISGSDLGGMAAAAASYRVQFAFELPASVSAGSTVGLAMWDNSASSFTMMARSFSIIPRRII